MKQYLLLLSAIVIASLASCTKDSELDSTIVSAISAQTPIEFSTYATTSTSTKGSAVTSNDDFKGGVTTHGTFDVTALVGNCLWKLIYKSDESGYIDYFNMYPVDGDAVKYFDVGSVTYSSTAGNWENDSNMYWPNYSKIIYFAACAPSGVISKDNCTFTHNTVSSFTTESEYSDDMSTFTESYEYSFDYSVTDEIDNQIDLMYSMTAVNYLAPSDKLKLNEDEDEDDTVPYITSGVADLNDEDPVNLHFKHALTQVAFTATKDEGIEVYVKSITICNVYNSGTFTAKAVTDDADTSEGGDDTVGNSGDENDYVNVNNLGSWAAKYDGTWTATWNDTGTVGYATVDGGGLSVMSNYAAKMVDFGDTTSPTNVSAIQISGTTKLTSESNVLMLMPQKLTPWEPTTSTEFNYIGSYATGSTTLADGTVYSHTDGGLSDGTYANPSLESADRTLSYLAIDCEIYHAGIDEAEAKIHDGYIYIPFETKDINYDSANVDGDIDSSYDTDAWLPGYKITYCLNFGGGYIVEEGDHNDIPEPGCIPDTETCTLRTITYTTTVDKYVDVTADDLDLGEYDTSL